MGKYDTLRGRVPFEEPEQDAALEAVKAPLKDLPVARLVDLYNLGRDEKDRLAELAKTNQRQLDVLDELIRARLVADETDQIRSGGYTWSENVEPYPVVTSATVEGIVDYFKTHGMEDQLQLKPSELAARLKTLVKAEAEANELRIETETVTDPVTGEEKEKSVVYSQTGARVFLKSSLSRRKSNTKKE